MDLKIDMRRVVIIRTLNVFLVVFCLHIARYLVFCTVASCPNRVRRLLYIDISHQRIAIAHTHSSPLFVTTPLSSGLPGLAQPCQIMDITVSIYPNNGE